MSKFPTMPEAGTSVLEIYRTVREIIDYLPSLKIIGDNKSTSVTSSSKGQIIHSISKAAGGAGAAGGGGGGEAAPYDGPFAIGALEQTSGGWYRVPIKAGQYYVFSSTTVNINASYVELGKYTGRQQIWLGIVYNATGAYGGNYTYFYTRNRSGVTVTMRTALFLIGEVDTTYDSQTDTLVIDKVNQYVTGLLQPNSRFS